MMAAWVALVLIAANIHCLSANQPSPPQPPSSAAQSPNPSILQYFSDLQQKDTCGTIYTSKLHGYDLKEYKVTTKDNYELKLHRLVHPQDFTTNGPPPGAKKPYLLLHGLIGTSASYLVNIDDQYLAPATAYNARHAVHVQLEDKAKGPYQFHWQSTAQKRRQSHHNEPIDKFQRGERTFAHVNEFDMDGDQLPSFGRHFKQAYRQFEMPKDSLPWMSNSLAMTLANFGYDVWLINLRGNKYSRHFHGRLSADHSAEYWDFNIKDIVREDLLASINFVQTKSEWKKPMGMVAFSYNNIHVLNLLAAFPAYQDKLQPVVMLAPALMTGQPDRGKSRKILKSLTKVLISKNGPWPAVGRSFADSKLEYAICRLPIASRLCRLFEIVLQGQSQKVRTVGGLIGGSFWADRKEKMIRRDVDCGQTSKQVLHQIIENLSSETIHPNYNPFNAAQMRGKRHHKRSVILMTSAGDEICSPSEVKKIRDDALRATALVDYVIEDPEFGHTDFLFSRKNEYLVNAEVTRMALVFDYLSHH